jgi:ribosomal protein S2
MFYNRHTGNKERFKETSSLGVLQSGVVDSNSDREYINFLVNANEKSELSTEYFLNLFLNATASFAEQNKINFILKWERN